MYAELPLENGTQGTPRNSTTHKSLTQCTRNSQHFYMKNGQYLQIFNINFIDTEVT